MRSVVDSKIAGVCGGIAEYFDIDSTLVRVIFVVLSVFPGGFAGGLIVYVLCWVVMPKAPALLKGAVNAPLEPVAK
jgi:phage shock protein PspC (stress-responsive transcriptional regulator)